MFILSFKHGSLHTNQNDKKMLSRAIFSGGGGQEMPFFSGFQGEAKAKKLFFVYILNLI